MQGRDSDIQRVIDESAIRHLLSLYPRALDRHDHALLASLFHPDAIDEHGHYNGSASGYVDWIAGLAVPGNHFMHTNGTQIIEIDGHVAHAETYCLAIRWQSMEGGWDRDNAPQMSTSGNPGGGEIFLRCRYLDRVEKRNGEWKIAHRRVVFSPCNINPVTELFALPPGCLLEGDTDTDPLYAQSV